MRKFGKYLLVVLALVVGTSAVAPAAESTKGSFWYIIDNITDVTEGAEAVIWVTLPPEWHGQEITLGDITPTPVAIIDDPQSGNRIIEWRLQPEPLVSDPMSEVSQQFFRYDFVVRELEVRKHGIETGGSYDPTNGEYIRYTRQEPGIQIDGRILDLAREIAGNEKEPYAIGRMFYGWIMENLEFKPNGATEWDALSIRDGRQGNCDQFSTLFVALCRSVGIPARTVANTYLWGGRHVFAEIMVPDNGWVPVDPTLGQMMTAGRGGLSEAEVEAILTERKVPLGDAGWTYGNMFGNRMIISLGKNITFRSPTLEREITLQRMASTLR